MFRFVMPPIWFSAGLETNLYFLTAVAFGQNWQIPTGSCITRFDIISYVIVEC